MPPPAGLRAAPCVPPRSQTACFGGVGRVQCLRAVPGQQPDPRLPAQVQRPAGHLLHQVRRRKSARTAEPSPWPSPATRPVQTNPAPRLGPIISICGINAGVGAIPQCSPNASSPVIGEPSAQPVDARVAASLLWSGGRPPSAAHCAARRQAPWACLRDAGRGSRRRRQHRCHPGRAVSSQLLPGPCAAQHLGLPGALGFSLCCLSWFCEIRAA